MERYDSYKDLGVVWIGEVPSHWEFQKLKHISNVRPSNVDKHIYEDEIQVHLCNYTDVYYNETINSNTYLKKGSCNDNEYEKFKLDKGDVIITKDSETRDDIGIPVYVEETLENVVCGYHLTMIKPILVMGKFIFRFIECDRTRRYFELNSNGVTRYGLGKSSIENLVLPIPSEKEQQQITSFLDSKTSLIDSLIEKTLRKIELLKEKRTSLINEVVTKGLKPNVEMKDSRVQWIGEIPSGWNLKQLKHIIKTLNSGTSVNSEDTPVTNLGEYGVLKTSCVFGDTFRPNENKKVVLDEYYRVKCPVLKDSIIFSRMNTPDLVGSNGYVDTDYHNLFLPDRLWITEFIENIQLSVKWLSFVTISRRFRSELSSRSTGTSPSMKNITKDDLLTIKIPYPSFLEQQQIVEYLDEHTQLIDKTISIEEKRIELLKEYRQSLISEVVTGKRKVVEC